MTQSNATAVARHRVTHACLHAIRRIPAAQVAKKTGLCAQTIRNLRRPVKDGGTMFPRLHTVAMIANKYGFELRMVEKSDYLYPEYVTKGNHHVEP